MAIAFWTRRKTLAALAVTGFLATACAHAVNARQAQNGTAPVRYSQMEPASGVKSGDRSVPPPLLSEKVRGVAGPYLAARHAQTNNDWNHAAQGYDQILAHSAVQNLENTLPAFDSMRETALVALINGGKFDQALALANTMQDAGQINDIGRAVLLADAMNTGKYQDAVTYLAGFENEGMARFIAPILANWTEAGLREKGQSIPARLKPFLPPEDRLSVQHFKTPAHALHHALAALNADRHSRARDTFLAGLKGNPSPQLIRAAVFYFLEQGETERARSILSESAAQFDSHAIHALLAELEDGKAERQAYEKAVLDSPRFGAALAFSDIAEGLLLHRGRDSALMFVRLSLALNPDLPHAQWILGDIYGQNGQSEAALRQLQALQTDPLYGPKATLRMADIMAGEGRAREAIELLQNLQKDSPEPRVKMDAWSRIGNLYRQEDNLPAALKAYDKTESIIRAADNLEMPWQLYYARGVTYERSGMWDKAETDLEKAIDINPDNPYIMNYLAYSWADREIKLERALKLLRRAVRMHPEDGAIIDSLGWTLYRMGRYDSAVPLLERAVALKPYDAVINDHLGDIYWRTGRRIEARYQWHRALENSDTGEEEPGFRDNVQAKLSRGLPPSQEADQLRKTEAQEDKNTSKSAGLAEPH